MCRIRDGMVLERVTDCTDYYCPHTECGETNVFTLCICPQGQGSNPPLDKGSILPPAPHPHVSSEVPHSNDTWWMDLELRG